MQGKLNFMAMMAKTEEDLQTMLDTLYSWCKRWRVLINVENSKCMLFRKRRKQRSTLNSKSEMTFLKLSTGIGTSVNFPREM